MLSSVFIVGIYWFKRHLSERVVISEIDLECGDNTKYRRINYKKNNLKKYLKHFVKKDSLAFSNSFMMFYLKHDT